jgi:hypothetical protein
LPWLLSGRFQKEYSDSESLLVKIGTLAEKAESAQMERNTFLLVLWLKDRNDPCNLIKITTAVTVLTWLFCSERGNYKIAMSTFSGTMWHHYVQVWFLIIGTAVVPLRKISIAA